MPCKQVTHLELPGHWGREAGFQEGADDVSEFFIVVGGLFPQHIPSLHEAEHGDAPENKAADDLQINSPRDKAAS